ncbi:conjugal transfer coupling protein TraG [Hyphomonas hirschiana VP5]|uniref:Conjugal transfer coupling protein TraG n=1 Tax=Hyphomonas hirschiana VP5 TaxID=1280951 RepID=A0A059FP97_9PROT|nr:conjugal transfer coupling protein TraG [Hyphomonas hirschiana VP5]
MRLVLNQIARRLTEQEPDPSRRKLLLMLDEFPALGRIDFFETALAFMAGYGVRAFLVAQSLNQIEKAYGPNNAILDNCHVRVAFATNDERTAKRIHDLKIVLCDCSRILARARGPAGEVKKCADLVETETKLPGVLNKCEPGDLGLAVNASPVWSPLRSWQQTDLLIKTYGGNLEFRAARHLADREMQH